MRPLFLASPIGSLKALAAAIGTAEATLLDFAANTAEHYSHFTVPKKNGKPRNVCAPSFHLKILQKRINRAIFDNVEYPAYLFGGIAGRDYVKNARAHSGARVAISLDVRDFYPSITKPRVVDVFKHFCKFPQEVADVLASLVTLHGTVPQGACTSSHIANLVLHDVEHRVVREFHAQKLTYTRLLDDICISSQTPISPAKVQAVMDKVRMMLKCKGFKLRNSKTRVTDSSNPEDLLEVTGLWLNRGAPRVKREERRDIRAAVHRCEEMALLSRTDPAYHEEHNRVSGRVSKLAHVGHFEAEACRMKLTAILPLYDQIEVNKTIRLARTLLRSKPGDRATHSFFERFHMVQHRLGILSRNNPTLAIHLRASICHLTPAMTREDLIHGSDR